jgi:hypothetical protein
MYFYPGVSVNTLNDYSEVTSTAHRDIDVCMQLLREGKWAKADLALTDLAKNLVRAAIWSRDKAQEEERRARMSIGRELLLMALGK